MQITEDINNYAQFTRGISVLAVYGGASIAPQIQALKKGAHIVVGTPGRTLDLIRRNILKVNSISWLILDEADEMLNMGFKEDLNAILETTPPEKQTKELKPSELQSDQVICSLQPLRKKHSAI